MMLAPIIERADERAVEAETRVDVFKRAVLSKAAPRGFAAALTGQGLGVIAEIKRRSPSAGDIDASLDPVLQASAYESGGANAISVLTEPHFFGGSLSDLEAVRDVVSVPVLRKDFTRNEAQIWEARAAGADAVLLIVATLDQPTLERLIVSAESLGMDALVEAHSAEELDCAVEAGATLIGINNRDLATFKTDLGVGEQLAARIPQGVVSVGESGVSSVEGAGRMQAAGFDAILVGEALVRADDPRGFVAELRGVG